MMQFAHFPGFSGIKAGNKNGGEYHGKCPGNGPDCTDLDHNEDRMRVWPLQGQTGGRWDCRKCGRKGDAIQWLRDFQGLGYGEACAQLGIEPKTKARSAMPGRSAAILPMAEQPRVLTVHPAEAPAPAWIEHAGKFGAWCHEQLLRNPEQLAYLAGRGIGQEAVVACRLGWNPEDTYRARESWGLPTEKNEQTGKVRRLWLPAGLVIPVHRAGVLHRVRIRRTEAARATMLPKLKYYRVPGSVNSTMILGDGARAFAVVEAELDACAIFSAAADLVGAVSIETLEGNVDAGAHALLGGALAILNALDADDPKTPALQRAVAKWANTYQRTIRWPVPDGKDPGEAVTAGVDLRDWILAGLPPVFRIAVGGPEVSGLSGPSGLVRGGAAISEATTNEAASAAADEVEKPETVSQDEQGAEIDESTEVEELAALLLKSAGAVWIVKQEDGGGLEVRPNQDWKRQNRAAYDRICRLVFYSSACGQYIDRHPATVIKAGNWRIG